MLKPLRVSPYERDHQCEHDGATCEKRAAAWTVKGGNGYIVACSEHAAQLVTDAVEAGEIVDSDTLEPFTTTASLETE